MIFVINLLLNSYFWKKLKKLFIEGAPSPQGLSAFGS